MNCKELKSGEKSFTVYPIILHIVQRHEPIKCPFQHIGFRGIQIQDIIMQIKRNR